ncbi:hypothetical protein [Mycobacteroides abscessus]|uniref:hypothetical protein n=1 Tax=Mycobacteroides abscessus TaxID=36809 RepID=UPI001F2485F4|nr:hypothetical protein [Mycobacteroides abscessus]
MNADNTEQVAAQDLVEGDVVLHPERQMWMRIVRILDDPENIVTYTQGETSTTTRAHRQLMLDPIHRQEVETTKPHPLDYRDAGLLEEVTRWTGGDLPTQRY